MKPLLSILLGFTVALGLVGTGIAGTLLLLSVGPAQEADADQNVVQLWSAEPRRVDRGTQGLERLPSIAHDAAKPDDSVPVEIVEPLPSDGVDTFTTASLPDTATTQATDPSPSASYMSELLDSHVTWCADRYRSYRMEDDSYTPYRGGRRLCVSPWSEELAETHESGGEAAAVLAGLEHGASGSAVLAGYAPEASADLTQTAMAGDAHVEECFSRYRSYRPEDNTYQPYGGGPRRQCE